MVKGDARRKNWGKGTREKKKIQLKIALVCEKETQKRVRVEKAISV